MNYAVLDYLEKKQSIYARQKQSIYARQKLEDVACNVSLFDLFPYSPNLIIPSLLGI